MIDRQLSRSRRALAFCWLVILVVAPDAGAQRLCWPPLFEGGARLHRRGAFEAMSVELMFRQHEACWRVSRQREELRVFLTGNSGIYGFPLPAEKSLAGLLNRRFEDGSPSVHFFNAGHVYTDQLKDALILHELRGYDPDLIVHAVILEDFRHRVALGYLPLRHFYEMNVRALDSFAREEPPGLAEPLEAYRRALVKGPLQAAWVDWRQTGFFVRLSVQRGFAALRDTWLASPGRKEVDSFLVDQQPQMRRQRAYSCAQTMRELAERFRNWKEWNILAYLEQFQEQTGARVVVLNWPIAYEPVGRCYNVRFTREAVDDFNAWVREEARRRGLVLLDYHDLLASDEFFDSLHPTAEGLRRVEARLAADLRPLLATLRLELDSNFLDALPDGRPDRRPPAKGAL